jgi:hypothetical protein
MEEFKWLQCPMKRMRYLILPLFVIMISACTRTDRFIEDNVENRDYPLPQVVTPVVTPAAEFADETAEKVLQERTLKDTTRPGKKGGYRATLFPESKSKSDDGTAFKLSW